MTTTMLLSVKNFGKLMGILESKIYKKYDSLELLFKIEGKTVFIYNGFLELLFTFEDAGE